MKRKVMALVCAATLVLGMNMTVFAAPSSSAEGTASSSAAATSSSSSATTSGHTTGTQTITEATAKEMAADTTANAGAVTAVSDAVLKEAIAEANALYGENSFIATVVDIAAPAGATFPYELTINNKNVWAGQQVTILHKVGGTWERLTPSKVGNNTVTVTVNSFSPFAIVINTAGSASPKTQDIALMVGACAALFAAGVVMTSKKREQR